MGMHFSLVAVKASVHQLQEAFSEVWPSLHIVDSARGLDTPEAFFAWMSDNERFVSAAEWTVENPGTEAFAFFQDGPWGLLYDPSYVLAADEAALQELSNRFGTALSFVVQTTSGCAFFWCYENGQFRRSILTSDGPTELLGESLPEEAGLDVQHYYMDETEALMAAFGLAPLDQQPLVSSAIAIAVEDRTDYDHLEQSTSAPSVALQPKPWWKFW